MQYYLKWCGVENLAIFILKSGKTSDYPGICLSTRVLSSYDVLECLNWLDNISGDCYICSRWYEFLISNKKLPNHGSYGINLTNQHEAIEFKLRWC
jgi:hypothetical protein